MTIYNTCFKTPEDLNILTESEKNAAAELCRSQGECTCASFEQMLSYRNNSCRYTCKKFTGKNMTFGKGKIFLKNPTPKQKCKKYNAMTESERNQIAEWCNTGTYTGSWTKKQFNVKRSFIVSYSLNSNAVLDANNRPTFELSKLFAQYLNVTQPLRPKEPL